LNQFFLQLLNREPGTLNHTNFLGHFVLSSLGWA